ncbi:MAG: hypothetical protein LM559_01920, partial [Pyrobaculum sp.]|nr:hypothetical protein [Pyrobaculum sp.]
MATPIVRTPSCQAHGGTVAAGASSFPVVWVPPLCGVCGGKVYIPSFRGVFMSLAAKRRVRIRLYGTNPADVD